MLCNWFFLETGKLGASLALVGDLLFMVFFIPENFSFQYEPDSLLTVLRPGESDPNSLADWVERGEFAERSTETNVSDLLGFELDCASSSSSTIES